LIVQTVERSVPRDHGLPGSDWTLKKLACWLGEKYQRVASRNAIRRVLREAGLTWKKCKKLLGKRDRQRRADYLERFRELYEQVRRGEVVLVYVDESHFHRDLEVGYTWGRVGERIGRPSDCPGLAERINWYGAYNFSDGQCFIWNEGNCNKEHTVAFLHHLLDWLDPSGRRVVVIWDGAPWHKAHLVSEAAAELGIELIRLPAYSPDLNPIEGLWKWMREEVTQLCCHPTLRALFDACKDFIDRINQTPMTVVNRLWPRFELDEDVEKLQLSG
jgi:transposase